MKATKCKLGLLLLLGALAFGQEPGSKQLRSPKGEYAVQIVPRPLPGSDPDVDFFTLVLYRAAKPIARLSTYGYLISAHWSSDGKFAAINNRRGNSGDYIWVFQLPDGKELKRPDDKYGEAWQKAARDAIKKKYPAANENSFVRAWLTARGWKEGQLEILVRAIYRGDESAFDFEGLVNPTSWSIVSSSISKTKQID